jgi:hypothetical protein
MKFFSWEILREWDGFEIKDGESVGITSSEYVNGGGSCDLVRA